MFFQIIVFFLFTLSATVISKNTKIIGGIDANIVEFPFLAALTRISDNKLKCGGAIISNQNILTAAHCVYKVDDPNERLKIVVGNTNISSSTVTSFLIDKIFVHPNFMLKKNEKLLYKYDIAVVKLEGIIEFNRFQNKIDLPTSDVFYGGIGIIGGWGMTSYPSKMTSDTLKKVWMSVLSKENCKLLYPYKTYADQFCAFQSIRTGVCAGDSGSPLISLGRIIGIASMCIPCATGVPDIYTNVYLHIDFVRSTM